MSVTISVAKTNYSKQATGNLWLRATAQTAPATVYLALLTADPTDAGSTANELSGNGYARMAITFKAATSDGAGAYQWLSNGSLSSATATANWATTTYGAIMDASSGGNMLYKGQWSSSVTVLSGQFFQLADSALVIKEY